MNLPGIFVDNIHNAFPLQADRWLESLPELLKEAADRWQLMLGLPFLLSYNYVCAATRLDGTEAVLKIGVPNPELTSEIAALEVYAGKCACRLFEYDPARGMLLLERLFPGKMLATLKNDDEATVIAADILTQTQRPVPPGDKFLNLKGWFNELKKVRVLVHEGTGPFPKKSFEMVEGLIQELFAEGRSDVLLHGDFHHFNILLSQRGWLVIDPKGVVGPAEYDLGPLLTNPFNVRLDETEAIRRTQRRIAILAERTGFEPDRMRKWAICHSVLSSFWDLNEDGSGGENAREWTKIFIDTKV